MYVCMYVCMYVYMYLCSDMFNQSVYPLTSEKKFINKSHNLLRDKNNVFISDCGIPQFL